MDPAPILIFVKQRKCASLVENNVSSTSSWSSATRSQKAINSTTRQEEIQPEVCRFKMYRCRKWVDRKSSESKERQEYDEWRQRRTPGFKARQAGGRKADSKEGRVEEKRE